MSTDSTDLARIAEALERIAHAIETIPITVQIDNPDEPSSMIPDQLQRATGYYRPVITRSPWRDR